MIFKEKKNRTAVVCLLLSLILLLPSLSACTNSDPVDSTESGTDTAAVASSPVTLAENGKVIARVVRGFNASDGEITAAKAVRTALMNLFPGSEVEITDDYSADKSYGGDTVEILVGKTEYPQSTEAYSELPYGDYGVKISGNKVLLLAWVPTVMPLLASNFADILYSCMSEDKSSLTLTPEKCSFSSCSNELSEVPVAGESPVSIINSGNSAYQLYFSPADTGLLSGYSEKLTAAGFTTCSDRTVGKNRFMTFKNSNVAVTAYYTDTNKTVRVIVEPVKNYYGTGTATKLKSVTPSLTMIGRRFSTTETYLNTDAGAGLMCFLIQLSDGRFIVIDGGLHDGIASYSQALYSKMLELAPDKNNVDIAAWIITHSHSDHIGGFCSFAASYSSKVKLEAILYNFPSEADHKAASDETNDYKNLSAAIGSYFSRVPVYKPHTGQRYSIGDAVVEILYTHEDFVTKTRTIGSVTNNWNNSSMIFSVEIAGEKLMFLGDSQEIPNNITAAVYGSYLKSDICQVAHHGGIGGTNSIYNVIDPEIALFTTSDLLVPVYISKFKYNYHLINELNVKEYRNAADRIVTLSLPYHATGSGFVK